MEDEVQSFVMSEEEILGAWQYCKAQAHGYGRRWRLDQASREDLSSEMLVQFLSLPKEKRTRKVLLGGPRWWAKTWRQRSHFQMVVPKNVLGVGEKNCKDYLVFGGATFEREILGWERFSKLPEKVKIPLRMFLEGHSSKKIAARMGWKSSKSIYNLAERTVKLLEKEQL